MAPKLLPAAKIGIKKKTISADSIRPNSPKEEKPLAVPVSKIVRFLNSVFDWSFIYSALGA